MQQSQLFALAIVTAALGGFATACVPPPETAASLLPEPSAPVVEYVTHQEILTPLPLRVRLPSRYGAERVLVFYRTWGSRDWETLELARAGQTWSGAVSCRDVSTVTGDTRYFFVALDTKGDEVVGSGWEEWPHVATIVRSLPEGAEGLPGMGPPMRCHDPADCPPDFPGCPAYALVRPACGSDDDCDRGGKCAWDGYCDQASQSIASSGTESDEDRLEAALRKATHRHRSVSASSASARAR